jgi:eukaryotic-like serine/threonine-protein kinase
MRPTQAENPERVGNYQVLDRLGQGAMGAVFLARSAGGRLVAVKVAKPELAANPEFRERFRQEVAALRMVGGFWTAAVVDADPDATYPWLATEYVRGPTLYEAVTAHGPLPEPTVRRLAAGLAEALIAIHGAGLIHRDLKPANVLLAEDGPRVIDFGIAKALEGSGLTATGMLIGTPGFLSPEQIEGGEITPASDVFALGSVVVYAATGTGPFGTGEAAALVYRAIHTPPELDGVPAGLRAVVARCLDRRPARRPTPTALLAEIGAPDTTPWLPAPVLTMLGQQRTDIKRPATPRPATRPYTKLTPAPGPAHATPGADQANAIPDPGFAAAPGAGPANAPGPVNASGPGHAHGPGMANVPAPEGNHAVFRTSPLSALTIGLVTTLAALICGAISKAASVAGRGGFALLFLIAFVLLIVPAIRLLWTLVRPRPWIELSGSGLVLGRGSRRRQLAWSRLSRVRVIEDRRRPWLVVWLNDRESDLGTDYRQQHGGFRVFPVGHERRRPRRNREVRELRAALAWYGRTVYDPSP